MLNYLLVLLLLVAPVAPFELLFNETNMTHEMNQSSVLFASMQMDDSHIQMASVNLDINTANSEDCETDCPHCVFCSAAISPILPLNSTHLLSIYNPYVNELSSDLYPDLHIEPPITL